MRRLLGLIAALAVVTAIPAQARGTTAFQRATQEVAYYRNQLPTGSPVDCVGPATNPAPRTAAWTLRDLENQYCAVQRIVDEVTSPAFQAAFLSETPLLFGGQTLTQLGEPGHLHVSLGQLVPGGTTADPFRSLDRWTNAGRGRVTPITFPATDGAILNGALFEPPASRPGPYPGAVITTGSLQGYQQVYYWAAEGLAEAGYMVMTYDVQGQGDSDTLPAHCGLGSCPGVPFQQSYNFFQGSEDALNFFLSTPAAPYHKTFNPLFGSLNPSEVGIAGHSLGAGAVSELGQCDRRVKAVVAWDNLSPATGPCRDSIAIPAADSAGKPTLKTPALALNSEYFLNPEPMTSVPDPHAKDDGYRQLAGVGTDTMQVALRSSMHLEYSYIPLILPASELGERVAFYYTLAWFDYYVRHIPSAYQRLVGTSFDDSSDSHSIGAGTYDPSNPLVNVPYAIAGLPVNNRLSFYYESEYTLTPPGASAPRVCLDMRAGCPTKAPPTP